MNKKKDIKSLPLNKRHQIIQQIKELVVDYDLQEMSVRTGIPKTTLSDWRIKDIPISVDRAVAILEEYGFKIELTDVEEDATME